MNTWNYIKSYFIGVITSVDSTLHKECPHQVMSVFGSTKCLPAKAAQTDIFWSEFKCIPL